MGWNGFQLDSINSANERYRSTNESFFGRWSYIEFRELATPIDYGKIFQKENYSSSWICNSWRFSRSANQDLCKDRLLSRLTQITPLYHQMYRSWRTIWPMYENVFKISNIDTDRKRVLIIELLHIESHKTCRHSMYSEKNQIGCKFCAILNVKYSSISNCVADFIASKIWSKD